MIEIGIPIAPVAKGRPRMTRAGHTYTPQKTREAEACIREWVALKLPHNHQQYTGPLEVTMVFYLKKPKTNKMSSPIGRPDLDNFIKTLMDACNDLVWKDDSQIVCIHAEKDWTDKEPRMFLAVSPTV
jgi:Holliday junction resolvase RusA-like endonuclease